MEIVWTGNINEESNKQSTTKTNGTSQLIKPRHRAPDETDSVLAISRHPSK